MQFHEPSFFFRLFNIVDVELRQFSPTFRTFLRLLDNYIYVTKVEESYTEVDQREMEDFLDEVIASRTMKTLHDFLVARGKLFWGWGAGVRGCGGVGCSFGFRFLATLSPNILEPKEFFYYGTSSQWWNQSFENLFYIFYTFRIWISWTLNEVM